MSSSSWTSCALRSSALKPRETVKPPRALHALRVDSVPFVWLYFLCCWCVKRVATRRPVCVCVRPAESIYLKWGINISGRHLRLLSCCFFFSWNLWTFSQKNNDQREPEDVLTTRSAVQPFVHIKSPINKTKLYKRNQKLICWYSTTTSSVFKYFKLFCRHIVCSQRWQIILPSSFCHRFISFLSLCSPKSKVVVDTTVTTGASAGPGYA